MSQVAGALEIQLFAGLARLQSDMNQATSIVGGAMKDVQSAVATTKAALGALGISLGAGYFVSLIKGSIDAMDHLDNLTKSTSLTIAELSGLKLLAASSGSDLDGLAKAIDKMSVAMGKSPEKFAALGVTAKDNAGAFKQLSDIFNSLTDVQQRNALAQSVFGKSWAEVAPALSLGSKAIGELMDKGAALSGVTAESAAQAKLFKEQMAQLETTLGATKDKLVGEMLPGMNDIAKAMQEAAKEGGLLMAVWVAMGGVMANLLGMTDAQKLKKQLADINHQIDVVQKQLRAGTMNPAGASDSIFSALIPDVKLSLDAVGMLSRRLDDLKRQKEALNPSSIAGTGAFDVGGSTGFGGTKPLKDSNAAAAAFLDQQKKAKAAADELGALLDRLQGKSAGFSASFVKDWELLAAGVGSGTISTGQYTLALAELMKEQPNVIAGIKAQADAQEHLNKITTAAKEAEVDDINARGDVLDALKDSVEALQEEYDAMGMTDEQRKLYILDLQREKALKFADDADVKKINAYYDELTALTKLGAVKGRLLSLPNETASAWTKAGVDIQEALTKAFGASGAAAGAMFKSYADGQAAQIAIDQDYATKRKASDANLTELNAKQQEATTENTLKMYGDMAGAAASYFGKQTTAYKVLHGIEQLMFAAKMAMALATMNSNVAVGLSGVASSGMQGAADEALLLVKIALGIANQANGDPYSAFARIAAMAALMAGVAGIAGVAFSFAGGGGGAQHVAGSVAAQASQGTGTILGDADAKSQSILNAMKDLRDNSSSDLLYTSKMLTALLNIESSMSGMAAAVAQSQLTGSGVKLPGAGGGNTFSLDNAGIILGRASNPSSSDPNQTYAGQTVAQLISAAIVTGFTDIARTHSGALGSSYTAVNRDQNVLPEGDALISAIGRTVLGIRDAIGQAVVVLTHGAMSIDQVNAILQNVQIDPMAISFADLKGSALVDALSQVFSALGDKMVGSILTAGNIQALQDFQHVGEGAFETLIRVASGVERAQATLDQWGIKMIDWQDIVNKQGDVTTELIRGSIVAATTVDGVTSSIGLLVKGFDGSADDIIGLYKTLLKLSVGLRASAIDTSLLNQAMITAAGGLTELQSGLDAYNSQFFTATEQAAAKTAELASQFTALGLTMPTTRAEFRAMVEAATAAGDSTLLGHLLSMAGAFADLVPAITDASGAAADLTGNLTATAGALLTVGDYQAAAMSDAAAWLEKIKGVFSGEDFVTNQSHIQAALNDQIAAAAAHLAAVQASHLDAQGHQTPLDWQGMPYADIVSAITQLNEYRAQLAALGVDMARYYVLEAANPGHGKELMDLEDWYHQQQAIVGNNQAALAALDEIYQAKRLAILQGGNDAALSDMQKAMDSLKGYVSGLLLNTSLTTLTPMQQLDEARRQYQSTLAAAQGGDVNAMGNLSGMSDTYLAIARQIFASSGAYNAIFRQVVSDVGGVGGLTQTDINTRLAAAIPQGTMASKQDVAEVTGAIRDLIGLIANGVSVSDPQAKAALDNVSVQLQGATNSGLLA